MKQLFLTSILFTYSIFAYSQFAANGRFTANGTFTEEEPVRGLGLENIYIFKSLSGATISYETESNHTVNIYTYENSFGDKNPVHSSNISTTNLGTRTTRTVLNLLDNRALVMEDDNQCRIVWIIDYNLHRPILTSISYEETGDKCETLKLLIDKTDDLQYKGISGQVRYIDRKYNIEYDIKEWDDESKQYVDKKFVIEELNIGTELNLDNKVPNKDTQFTIRGDQFGIKFNDFVEKYSAVYQAVSVIPHIVAKQVLRDVPNEKKNEEELGGSAPVEIDFYGFSNEPVTQFYTWYIYDTNDMKNHIARFSDKDMNYTFNQFGDYKVVLETASAESTCVNTTSVTFNVSESFLDIPNFFTPRTSPGSNDEFRVVYKSLTDFRMTIVNRWGNKVYESRDPAQGWDGRYGGKLVNPGVYFYRIKATGADGVKYNEAGDINIL